jgi:hypothetical protein
MRPTKYHNIDDLRAAQRLWRNKWKGANGRHKSVKAQQENLLECVGKFFEALHNGKEEEFEGTLENLEQSYKRICREPTKE